MDASLPPVSRSPTQHPDCCLSLSTTLLTYLTSLFVEIASNQPATVLSIGSGTGLLEALISQYLASFHAQSEEPTSRIGVEGVEVQASPPVNGYLLEEAVNVVHGTWDVCPRAGEDDVRAWLFVYPRTVGLMEGYVERFVMGDEEGLRQRREKGGVEAIIWAGPTSDMDDYESVFRRLEGIGWRRDDIVSIEVGVREWEGLVVMRSRKEGEREALRPSVDVNLN